MPFVNRSFRASSSSLALLLGRPNIAVDTSHASPPPPPLSPPESDGAPVASCAGLLQPTCGRLAFQEAAVHELGLGYSGRLSWGIGAAQH